MVVDSPLLCILRLLPVRTLCLLLAPDTRAPLGLILWPSGLRSSCGTHWPCALACDNSDTIRLFLSRPCHILSGTDYPSSFGILHCPRSVFLLLLVLDCVLLIPAPDHIPVVAPSCILGPIPILPMDRLPVFWALHSVVQLLTLR